ncbi:MAG TPA: 5'/3'-nucleotidase SurE [Acidimicrobiales bacterium]
MRVLVTNDDGVESPGLHELAQSLAACGHDLVVAAPDRDMSGSSAAIGQVHIDEHIDAEPAELPGLDGVPAYAVDGPPGLCVFAARLGGFGPPPDLIVSGINPGANTGRAVLHSGTVGAALTAASFGCRGIAVSLDVSARHLHERPGAAPPAAVPSVDGTAAGPVGDARVSAEVVRDVDGAGRPLPVDGYDAPARWSTAAVVASSMMGWLEAAAASVVLNVNVPNVPFDQLAGMQAATLAPFGRVRAAVVESAEQRGRVQMELRPSEEELPVDCDTALVDQGFVAVTALSGIGRDPSVDLSDLLDDVLIGGGRTA